MSRIQRIERNSALRVRVEDETRDRIEEYCLDNDLTISQIIRKALEEFLDRNTKDSKK